MKRKFLATLAMLVLVLVGSFSPVLGFFVDNLQPHTAYAASTAPTATPATQLDCGSNFICAGVVLFTYFTQFVPNLLAEVSGLTLDYVVWKNLQSSTFTNQDQSTSFVVKGWDLVRDLSNLLFIFALFIVAFSLILSGLDNGPLFGLDPKRTIARVILMALLINFSFFMCRVIIDMTNLFATAFYTKIVLVGGSTTNANQSQVTNNTSSNGMGSTAPFYTNFAGIRSISLGILAQIDPQQLMLASAGSSSGFQQTNSWTLSSAVGWKSYNSGVYITLIFVSFIVGIFDFFLAYLFLSSAIFLIGRIFGLFFLIILSPIAFVSTTIPAFQKKEYFGFDDWFTQLTGLAFSLPIYMFFIWLALFFLKAGDGITTTSNMGYIAISGVIIVKLLAMGATLIFGKKISKDLSGKFGAMASNIVTGVATGAVMIAGAAMTGGASAALSMGGRVVGNGATTAARGIGGAVLGDERAEAWEQKVKGLRSGNSFKSLNNFNPARDMSTNKSFTQNAGQFFKNVGAATATAATMSGSKFPGQASAAYGQGTAFGTKAAQDKRIKDINAKLIDANKKFYDPNTSPADKAKLRMEIDGLEEQKKRAERGEPEPVRNAPPNAGTSGNNSANRSGGNTTGNGTTTNNTTNNTTNGTTNNSAGAGANPASGAGAGASAAGNRAAGAPNGNAGANPGSGGTNNGSANPGAGANPGANAGPGAGGAGAQGGPKANTNSNSGAGGGAGAGGGFNSGSRGGGNYNSASGGPGGGKSNSSSSNPGANATNNSGAYSDLGVGPNATWEEIKTAYNQSAKTDLKAGQQGDAAASERYRKAKEAYESLGKDPKYDAQKVAYQAKRDSEESTRSSRTYQNAEPAAPSSSKTVDLLNNIQNVAPRANATAAAAESSIVASGSNLAATRSFSAATSAPAASSSIGSGAIALGTGAMALGMGSSTPAVHETPTLKDRVVTSISNTPIPESQLGNSIDTITDVIHGKMPSISKMVGNQLSLPKMTTVGHEVDNVAKINNIPGVEFIPEVGEIAKGAGELGALANAVGITEQKPAIPLPPSTTQTNTPPVVRSDAEMKQWENIARAQNIDALQKKFNSDKLKT